MLMLMVVVGRGPGATNAGPFGSLRFGLADHARDDDHSVALDHPPDDPAHGNHPTIGRGAVDEVPALGPAAVGDQAPTGRPRRRILGGEEGRLLGHVSTCPSRSRPSAGTRRSISQARKSSVLTPWHTEPVRYQRSLMCRAA